MGILEYQERHGRILEVITPHKKLSFALRISSVNLTKCEFSYRLGHIY